jgi:hypothetical protein
MTVDGVLRRESGWTVLTVPGIRGAPHARALRRKGIDDGWSGRGPRRQGGLRWTASFVVAVAKYAITEIINVVQDRRPMPWSTPRRPPTRSSAEQQGLIASDVAPNPRPDCLAQDVRPGGHPATKRAALRGGGRISARSAALPATWTLASRNMNVTEVSFWAPPRYVNAPQLAGG